MPMSLELDAELKRRVDRLAAAQDRSPHRIMREAIHQYVERSETRDSFEHEALAFYKGTGLHVSGEEAIAWLRTWGTADETDAPECHE